MFGLTMGFMCHPAWLGPFTVLNDGLDADGTASLPGLQRCLSASGCIGDYPVLGIDEYGLWCGPAVPQDATKEVLQGWTKLSASSTYSA
jgi:hypothetical protein